MKRTTILVIQHHYKHVFTAEDLILTIEAPKEGPMHQSSLFSCTNCNTLFSASDQSLVFSDISLNEITEGKACPTCNAPLSSTIVRATRHLAPKVDFDKKNWREMKSGKNPLTYIECYDLTDS